MEQVNEKEEKGPNPKRIRNYKNGR